MAAVPAIKKRIDLDTAICGSKIAVWCSVASLVVLTIEHFLDHGRNLNAVNHWLSEYILSDSAPARGLMRAAFVLLAGSAAGVVLLSRGLLCRVLFGVSSIGLFLMAFFDSDPNDGRHLSMVWPPTPGNVHQLLLYVAMGGALMGMLVSMLQPRRVDLAEKALFALAVCATAAQGVLVAISHAKHEMTHFAGITERVIVVSVLLWVMSYRQRE